jgi:hypothetical protein
MKKKEIILIALLPIAILILVLNQILGMEKSIDVSKINLQEAQLPTSWICTWCEVETEVRLNWKYSDDDQIRIKSYQPIPFATDTEENFQEIYWVDIDAHQIITVLIIDYRYPIVSNLLYILKNPKGTHQKYYENFENDSDLIEPTDWKFENVEADKDSVQCGGGSQERCNGWFYRVRYGQYYLMIHPYSSMSVQIFEEIVVAITDEFEENIR